MARTAAGFGALGMPTRCCSTPRTCSGVHRAAHRRPVDVRHGGCRTTPGMTENHGVMTGHGTARAEIVEAQVRLRPFDRLRANGACGSVCRHHELKNTTAARAVPMRQPWPPSAGALDDQRRNSLQARRISGASVLHAGRPLTPFPDGSFSSSYQIRKRWGWIVSVKVFDLSMLAMSQPGDHSGRRTTAGLGAWRRRLLHIRRLP